MSLQSRLMALIVTLLCVVVFVVSTVLTFSSQNLTSHQTEKDGMTLAQLLSRSAGVMDRVPEDVERMLSDQMITTAMFISLLTKPPTKDTAFLGKDLQSELLSILSSTNLSFIHITDDKGDIIFSTDDTYLHKIFGGVDEKYLTGFKDVLEGKKPSYTSPPMEDENLRQMKYTAVPSFQHKGIVQLGYRFSVVEDIRKRLGFQRLAEVLAQNEQVKSVWIVDKDLNTLASSEIRSGQHQSNTLLEKDLDYLEHVVTKGETFSFFTPSDLTVMAPVFGKDKVVVGATLLRLKTDTFSKNLTSQIKYSVLIALLSVCMGIIASYYLSRSITNPVSQLIQAAGNVEQGRFDPESLEDISAREDELGLLSRVFQNMGMEVGQRAERLDALVKVRTKDLEGKTRDVERALEQLKSTQTQLVAKEKLASLGQLTAGIAHELKNPLNFVINFASLNVDLSKELGELLQKNEGTLAPKDVDYIQDLLKDLIGNSTIITTHGHHAEKIIASMIQHSHAGSMENEDIPFLDFMAKNIKLMEPVLQAKHYDFAFALLVEVQPGDDHMISLMPQEIKRVLSYILDNAFDAIYERAQEALDQGAIPPYQPSIESKIFFDAKGGYVVIRDNGIGIESDNLDKIFNPFFTTKPTRMGNTGMGLSLSYDIIAQQHSGNITVISEGGKGSTFTIFLPWKR